MVQEFRLANSISRVNATPVYTHRRRRRSVNGTGDCRSGHQVKLCFRVVSLVALKVLIVALYIKVY